MADSALLVLGEYLHHLTSLKDAPEGVVVVLVGDDPESRHDIPALLHRLGLAPPSVTESSGTFTFVIVNTAPPE